MWRATALPLSVVVALVFASFASADVGVKKVEGSVEVTLDGQPFATYVFDSGFKPIIWPIIGPTGKEMTRAWPLRKDNPTEKTDHVHQKSFWFDHGDVSGIDFWAETSADPNSERVKREDEAALGARVSGLHVAPPGSASFIVIIR